MGKIDRFIVPGTVVAAVLAMFLVTNAWIARPVDATQWKVTMGPLGITLLRHTYGLRFTPRNILSGHAIKTLIPLTRDCPPPYHECVDVTIVNRSLTYIYRAKAYRYTDGSYKIYKGYAFPRDDDYVIFVEMQPPNGPYQANRIPAVGALRLGRCRPRGCATRTTLRGKEDVRSQSVGGLTVVLGAPMRVAESGQLAALTLVALRGSRTALDVGPPAETAGDAIAISMDTYHFVRLNVDRAKSGRGVFAYTGSFSVPSIYRVWAPVPVAPVIPVMPVMPVMPVRRRTARPQETAQASFVVDVDRAPTPTPVGQ